MSGSCDFAGVCQRFFGNWLLEQREVSQETIWTYAQCFRLLIRYAVSELGMPPEKLSVSDFNHELLERFLRYLEKDRHNTVRTRNARLAALKSFFGYVGLNMPQYVEMAQRVAAIPSKKSIERPVPYLTREELNALVEVIDQSSWVGRRDKMMILFTAESGLRNSELTGLRQGDLELGSFPTVQCLGKGRKKRTTPITKTMVQNLKTWLKEQGIDGEKYLFPNRSGGRLSSDSFQYALKKYSTQAAISCRSLAGKRVTPHVLRHTAAMELLLAKVDITSIAGWLGHESLSSTEIYAQATLEMKEKALKKVEPQKFSKEKFKPDNKLMSFLKGL